MRSIAADSPEIAAIGSASRWRSAGWIHTGQPYSRATSWTHHMWSKWPCVTSTAAGVRLCSATTACTPSIASMPGSTNAHPVPGPRETT